MEAFELISAQVELLQMADRAQAQHHVVRVHEHAVAAEVIGRQIQLH